MHRIICRRSVLALPIFFLLPTTIAGAAQAPARRNLEAAARRLYIVLYGDPGYGGRFKANAGPNRWAEDLGRELYGTKGWLKIRTEPADKLLERYFVVLYGEAKGYALFREECARGR